MATRRRGIASSRKQPYFLLDHTADLALHVRGGSREELFTNAALGMFAQMADVRGVPLVVRREISLEAYDDEALLVAWLSELLYLREIHREAYARFQVRLPVPGKLEGVAEGGPWSAFSRPIKAVTYHGLKIKHINEGYSVSIVFDV